MNGLQVSCSFIFEVQIVRRSKTPEMSTNCRVCVKEEAPYQCPRCNAHYCSLECYRGHSIHCVATFHNAQLADALHGEVVSDEQRLRMHHVLQRLHNRRYKWHGVECVFVCVHSRAVVV